MPDVKFRSSYDTKNSKRVVCNSEKIRAEMGVGGPRRQGREVEREGTWK